MPFSFCRECGDLREELESVQCRVEEQVVAIVIVIVIAILENTMSVLKELGVAGRNTKRNKMRILADEKQFTKKSNQKRNESE